MTVLAPTARPLGDQLVDHAAAVWCARRFPARGGRLPVPWEALLLSIGVYVALPLVAGHSSRKWIIAAKGEAWFKDKFLRIVTPVTVGALLVTLVLLLAT